MPIHHGIKTNEILTGARAMVTAATAVIGLIAVSNDADALVFPALTPVLITNIRAVIDKAGVNGTLAKSLTAIAEICSPQMVVIRVATAADIPAAINALESSQSVTGVKPKILGIPGHDTQANTTLLVAAAKKLRAFDYAGCDVADTIAEAIIYRGEFGDRELMLLYPDFSAWPGQAVAKAMGLRAYLDEKYGWHYSLSNQSVAGVTGISSPISWNISGEGTDAAALNNAPVTTLIRHNGYKFWGNRTCSDEAKYAFEVAVRTNHVLQDTIDEGLLWICDKPITAQRVKDGLESINAEFRTLVTQERLIGATAWFDPDLNSATDIAGGKVIIDYDYTPCAPMESLGLNNRITDRYYANLAEQIALLA